VQIGVLRDSRESCAVCSRVSKVVIKRARAAEARAQLDGLAAVAGSSDPLACASILSCVLGFLVGNGFFITTVSSS
jgi:hypothetical protein